MKYTINAPKHYSASKWNGKKCVITGQNMDITIVRIGEGKNLLVLEDWLIPIENEELTGKEI